MVLKLWQPHSHTDKPQLEHYHTIANGVSTVYQVRISSFRNLFQHLPISAHYPTMQHFDTLKIYSCGKRKKCLLLTISPFLTMFSTHYGTYYAPFNKVGVYCFANVGRLVGRFIGRSVSRPYLVRMITRHRIDLGLSNLAQTCVSGCR